MKRRKFINTASLFATGMLIPVGSQSWIASGAGVKGHFNKRQQRLVVILLRGAADGLNIVVPHQSEEYYLARPTIAVPYPETQGGVIDLDGYFGLNPHLKALMPLWRQKQLAFVHAAGLPAVERSHFQAQDYIENGTPGNKSTADGWMNRLLAQLASGNPTQALNVGVTTPYIFKGSMSVSNLRPGRKSNARVHLDRPHVNQAFRQLYGGKDRLSLIYQNGLTAREMVLANLNEEMMLASRGAKNVNAFVDDAAEVAQLMTGDTKCQLAFMEIGGWDSHINQNNILNRLLPPLGEGLAILVEGLKPIFKDTVVVVLSEFGRTVAENGGLGTDHGYGNVMWLLGGGVRGGQIYGQWPGLSPSKLWENRDLAVTTDFREVLSLVAQQHLGIPRELLEQIFPGYQLANNLGFLQ